MQSEAERKFKAYLRGFSDAVSGQINRGEYGGDGEWLPYQQGWDSGMGVRRRAENRAAAEYNFNAEEAKKRERREAKRRMKPRPEWLRRVV